MVSLQQLSKVSFIEWKFLTEAFVLSAYSRFLIRFVPLKKFAALMGKYGNESDPPKVDNARELQLISSAIGRISRKVPWRCACYEQAFMGKVMLNRRKIPATIYFGLTKEDNKGMKAHAWLRCGSSIVTGKNGMETFTKVAWFS